MSRSSGVIAFARRAQHLNRLDALIANAGISPAEFERASQCYQHLSTYFLLLPQLQQTSGKHHVSTHLEVVSSELSQVARRPSGADLYESMNDPATFGSASQHSLTKLIELLVTHLPGARCESRFADRVGRRAWPVSIGNRTKYEGHQ